VLWLLEYPDRLGRVAAAAAVAEEVPACEQAAQRTV
jgi:hypothetical protein